MTEEQFCLWLRDFFEINEAGRSQNNNSYINSEHGELIKQKLDSVFENPAIVIDANSGILKEDIAP